MAPEKGMSRPVPMGRCSLTKGSAMSYPDGQTSPEEKPDQISTVLSPEDTALKEERDSASDDDAARGRGWLHWLLEPTDPNDLNPEGTLYPGYAYAPSVVAWYREPLRDSGAYLNVLSALESGGLTSLLTEKN